MRTSCRIVIISLLWSACCSSVLAAYFDGFFALDTGDYETAYSEWRTAASAGDAQSMVGLGTLYEDGLGVAQDDVMAAVYYELASLLGDSEADGKLTSVRRRMSQSDLNESRNIIGDVRSSGRLPPKRRKAGSGSSAQAQVIVSDDSSADAIAETSASASVVTSGPGAEIAEICKFKLSWQDRGSGGARDMGLHEPNAPRGVWFFGAHAQNNYKPAKGCVPAIRALNPELVMPPASWQLIWWDKGSGAQMDGSLWRAVPPSDDYVCLGSVARKGYGAPKTKRYGCVHRCMIVKSKLGKSLWDDRGTNAKKPVTVHRLRNAGVIVAFAGRKAPKTVDDLDMSAACVVGE
jgi:hypothetical protein